MTDSVQPVAGNTPLTRPANRTFYPALDGLRAVSFLAVFLHHYVGLPYGWAGVDVFFVLSGFLITGILYDTRENPHRVRNFYIRRTLRIFPLYYGLFLVLLLVTPIFHWAWSWQWLAWPLYVGNFLRFLYPHTNNAFVSVFADAQLPSHTFHHLVLYLGHFWTLCVEEQFYLIWPWVVFNVRDRRKLQIICVAGIVLVPIARFIALRHMPAALVTGEVVLHSTPFRFDTLLIGALIALLHRGEHRERMQQAARLLIPFGLVFLAVVDIHWIRFHNHIHEVSATWGLSVVGVLAGALLLRTLIPCTIAYRIFHLRWLRRIGVVSYGAYIFHDIPHAIYLGWIGHHFHHHVQSITAVVGLILTLIVSFCSYRWFESPILAMKDRLTVTR